MSNGNDDADEFSAGEDLSDFPIPRVSHISNPKPAIQPIYEPINDQFNPNLFQLFFSLVNYHIPAYDLSQIQQYTPALDTVGNAFESEYENSPVLQEHIIRKFLVECHFQMLKLTSNPSLTKMEMLHNELFLASEFLRLHKASSTLIDYCEMLLAETYDMFNSQFAKTVNEQYWNKGKSAEELINELLKKEIENIRILNSNSFLALSQCSIRRSIEKAGAQNASKITDWAKNNQIPFQE
ncbi:hypothetical protein M9Y10_035334 [Tritrichomonas musculus]|uniref:Uncharacterized protein n=1 Tax=Tritrichomonas musculus TaxID=1915356 RepID=A0ABR2KHG4_9EUKA